MTQILVLSMVALLISACSPFQPKFKKAADIPESSPSKSRAEGQKLYAQNCAGCHGAIESTNRQGASATLIEHAIHNVVQMQAVGSLKQLTFSQLEMIAVALEGDKLATQIGANGRMNYVCDPNDVPKSRILHLSNREFRNSVYSLLDGFATNLRNDAQLNTLINAMPSDIASSKEQNFIISLDLLKSVNEVAFQAGRLVAGLGTLSSYPNGACLANATLTTDCHRTFIKEFAGRAFRRPVSDSEASSLSTALWDATLSKYDALTVTVAAVMQMPDFYYKAFNLGGGTNRQLSMTAHELAAKVAFFLTGAPPDSTLRALADSGAILDKNTLGQQFDRLLASAGAQEMVKRLFRESYEYDNFTSFTWPANFLNGISTNGLQQAMVDELDDFFIETVLRQGGTFGSLMTSRAGNINNTSLGAIYGFNSAPGRTTLPANRSGFLNRAGMLAKAPGLYASAIKRGKGILTSVLCEPIKPPDKVPVLDGGSGANILTTRDKIEAMTERPGSNCAECHSRINPLGYAFEGFDSLGRARTHEAIFDQAGNYVNSYPINSSSTSKEIAKTAVSFGDSIQMMDHLANSDKAMLCFAKYVQQYEIRVAATSANNCQMNKIVEGLYGQGGQQGSITNALKQLLISDEFKRWVY